MIEPQRGRIVGLSVRNVPLHGLAREQSGKSNVRRKRQLKETVSRRLAFSKPVPEKKSFIENMGFGLPSF